jgi:hypothetical protein
MSDTVSTTSQKALKLNLDSPTYGSFAEIGAGQEVARWFFVVGGASRTVAKSISTYDMEVSDALYGKAHRYVSRQRLEAMLKLEFEALVHCLRTQRGDRTMFFAFGDTVATRPHGRDENGRGWLGVRFQAHPLEAPTEIILHAHLLDRSAALEQEVVGVLGVNLIHGAFYLRDDLPGLVRSLMDDLSRERVEIDMVKVSGPGFADVDNRLLSLLLVEQRLTDAAMFTPEGEVVQPSEVLYKRPILVERGSFRPATRLTIDLLQRAREQFLKDPSLRGADPVVVAEMNLRQLIPGGPASHEDFLARAEILHVLGFDVLISRFQPYYQLADYLARYTDQTIGIAVGLPTIRDILDERYYEDLSGGALESIGRLFKRSVKMYVYPMLDPATGRVIPIEDAPVLAPGVHVRELLLEMGRLVPLRGYDPSLLSIKTPDVLMRLQSGDPSWEAMVPPIVAEVIKKKRLLGCRTSAEGASKETAQGSISP